ncbi:MAG: hypothetical protein QXL96_08630 [Ignisphaera sp.]
MPKFTKLISLVGLIMGVTGLLGSVYLFMKQAVLVSMSRDVLGGLIDDPGDRELLNQWLNILADSWRTPIIGFAVYSLILVTLSLLLYITNKSKCN